MRTALLIGFVLLGTASAFAAEEPSGCDKFKWPIERERAALTAPDRVKLSSGGGPGSPAASGHRSDTDPAGRRQTSDATRARAEGRDLRCLYEFQECAEGRPLHD